MHNVPNLMSAISLSAGNTSGTLTNISSGTFYLAGGSNITLSQNANSVTISGPNPGVQNMAFWQNMGVNGSATDAMAQTRTVHGSLRLFQLDIGNNIFAGNMTISTVLLDVTVNCPSSSIATHASTVLFGLYTVNANQVMVDLINSGSVTFGSTNTSGVSTSGHASSYYQGKRFLSMHYSNFSNTVGGGITMSQGLYYAALIFLSSGATVSMSHYGAILGESGQRSGTIGAASSTQTFLGGLPFCGVLPNTTNAFPATIGSGQLVKTSLDAIFIPRVIFNNQFPFF